LVGGGSRWRPGLSGNRQNRGMTRRKPPGARWESWIDRQIREAEERGEFDDLPGAGKPIPDLDKPFDELWWVKDKLRREGLSYMPPSVALRKEAGDALLAASRARSEAEVRQIISAINEKIREANRKTIAGPPLMIVPYDVERVVRKWREQHSG
jgi:Domain of unknown function (DUF1992)